MKWNNGYMTGRQDEGKLGIYENLLISGVSQCFRWVPPGKFLMGSPDGEFGRFGDEDQHEVEFTKGFWLADTACTQELWKAVMGENPSYFKGDKRPVERVSWQDCQVFLGRVNRDISGVNFRLPTEAEWEYACRAGTTAPFSFGDNITRNQANFSGEKTVRVRSFSPNDWGLYEMHGNVLEWCSDWYGEYPTGRVVDPQGPYDGVNRVLRGGSWLGYGGWCRSARRYMNHPVHRNGSIGFRLARGQVRAGRQNGGDCGNYCTSIRYLDGWAIITDAYGKEIAISQTQIRKIIEESTRNGC